MGKLRKRPVLAACSVMAAIALAGTTMLQAATIDNVHSSAMEKTLNCHYEIHKHQDSCYDSDGTLICGYADWVVHTHNKDCYDSDGKLVCKLPEHPEHVHKYSCYGTPATGAATTVDTSTVEVVTQPGITAAVNNVNVEELKKEILEHKDEILKAAEAKKDAADNDETEADTDKKDETKSTAKPADNKKDEAKSTAKPADDKVSGDAQETSKPTESPVPTGTPKEDGKHVHTDKCTLTFKILDCDNDEKDHVHDDSCYVIVEIFTCQGNKDVSDKNPSMSPAPDSKEHVHNDNCYISIRVLTCGKDGEKGHTHTDACYKSMKVTACENRVPVCGEWELHTHTDKCFKDGKCVCGLLQVEKHVHDEKCFNLTSSIRKDKKKDDNKTKTIVKKKYVNNDGKGDGKGDGEIVKTGEAATPIVAILVIGLLAGLGYFFSATDKGKAIIKKIFRK